MKQGRYTDDFKVVRTYEPGQKEADGVPWSQQMQKSFETLRDVEQKASKECPNLKLLSHIYAPLLKFVRLINRKNTGLVSPGSAPDFSDPKTQPTLEKHSHSMPVTDHLNDDLFTHSRTAEAATQTELQNFVEEIPGLSAAEMRRRSQNIDTQTDLVEKKSNGL